MIRVSRTEYDDYHVYPVVINNTGNSTDLTLILFSLETFIKKCECVSACMCARVVFSCLDCDILQDRYSNPES